MKRIDQTIAPIDFYELVDSGEGRKLERFGDVFLDRPDPQALWVRTQIPLWDAAHAKFEWSDKKERWKILTPLPKDWVVQWNNIRFSLDIKTFKHVGLFPEHAHQWDAIAAMCKLSQCRVLNLFGYTGAASVVAASAGAQVTHVDASKQSVDILKQNMRVSGLSPDAIRTIVEDAVKYAKRLVQRGEQFDIIIMDPPAFGRGPKGEVWKIEEGLPELVSLVPTLLSAEAKLVILNGYAAGFAARTFGELLHDAMKEKRGDISYGDISLQQKDSDRLLTTGVYASWRR